MTKMLIKKYMSDRVFKYFKISDVTDVILLEYPLTTELERDFSVLCLKVG